MRNKQQNRKMIEKLCEDTWRDLYGFIYYKVQNREEAEDITQETYARAISFLKRNDIDIRECEKYLRVIAVNLIRDQWRGEKRRGGSVNLEEMEPEEMTSEDFADSLMERARIKDAMDQLTREQRTVIELRIVRGYTVSETGAIMKKQEGAVRALQLRALRAMAKLLETEPGKEGM